MSEKFDDEAVRRFLDDVFAAEGGGEREACRRDSVEIASKADAAIVVGFLDGEMVYSGYDIDWALYGFLVRVSSLLADSLDGGLGEVEDE